MVIELHQALETIESYFNSDTIKPITLGSMTGTKLFKHIFDLGLGAFNFNETLLIEGCQDYIGMSEPSPVHNHYFWADLIKITPKASICNINLNPFEFKIINNGNPVIEYNYEFDLDRINTFKLVYVCDAHLIPGIFLEQLKRYVQGKLIILVDPFTIYGLQYTNVPTVVRTFSECSQLSAIARQLFGIETEHITTKNVTSITGAKHNAPKTIARCNEIPVCTNDISYLQYMQDKQIAMGYKKYHRVIIDKHIFKRYQMDNKTDTFTVCEHSLLTTESVPGSLHSATSVRPWKHKNSFYWHFKYDEPMSQIFGDMDNTVIKCRPASVMTINDVAHHKFDKLMLVQSRMKNLSNFEKYTILTATEHLVITEE